jgi:hypothetical protein
MPHVDVEMTGQKCTGGVASSALMRRGVVDLHQLASDERVVGVGVPEISAKIRPRHQGVEHGRAGNRRVDREPARFTAQTYRLVESHEAGGGNQGDGREAMRIARSENNRVGTRERGSNQNGWRVDYPADEILNEGDVESR